MYNIPYSELAPGSAKREEQANIKIQRDVVRSNRALRRNLDRNFLQALHVLNLIKDGNEDREAGLKDPMELSHSFHKPCLLLRDEPDDGVCR
jgi:hypothetical protein